MGGGFGGKETQAKSFRCGCGSGREEIPPRIKVRPDRDDDMTATGKRHELSRRLQGRLRMTRAASRRWTRSFAARCGFSADLSGPVTDRALFHADNCYFYRTCGCLAPAEDQHGLEHRIPGFGDRRHGRRERIIEDVAYALGKDPLEIRSSISTAARGVT